jgi:acetyl-CoA carboxylase biotin carboxyl carrier protein
MKEGKKMDIDTLSDLLNTLEKTSFSKIKIKIDDAYLSLEKPDSKNKLEYVNAIDENIKDSLVKEIDENSDVETIKSPMVGVFYRSSNPDDEAFVKEGDVIKKGDTIGIIEAMKLMNEIVSDFDGEIVEICGEDKTNVGYGQPLIKIKIK